MQQCKLPVETLLGEFGNGLAEVMYLWIISIADIFEILARFKKMGFSAHTGNANDTHRGLSHSLAGANK